MLEHHTIDFIRKLGSGFGLYGEQGAEGIHPIFNNLYGTNSRMKPTTRRLESIMAAYLTCVNPMFKTINQTKKGQWRITVIQKNIIKYLPTNFKSCSLLL